MGNNRNNFAGRLLDERFKLLAELSSDPTAGDLFIAQDQHTQSTVYIRLLSNNECDYAAYAAVTELCASIKDRRILPIAHHGQTADLVYYTIPSEAGLSQSFSLYDTLAAGGALPCARAVNIASQVCVGLEHAHSRGLLHGNLNPKSVLLTTGERGEQARLWDFGTASGTPGLYMARYSAPERLNGQPADVRSDIYSLGVMLYEMCTGHLPLLAATDDLDGWRTAHTRGTPQPLRTAQPLASEALDALVMQCLQRDPLRRPLSMLDITRVLCSPTRPVRPPVTVRRTSPLPYLFSGAAVLLVAGVFTVISVWPDKTPVERPSIAVTKPPAAVLKTVSSKFARPSAPRSAAVSLPVVARSGATDASTLTGRTRPQTTPSPRRRLATVPLRPDPKTSAISLLRPAPRPVQDEEPSAALVMKSSPQPLRSSEEGDSAGRLRSAPQPINP